MEPYAEKVKEAQCKNCHRSYDVTHVEIFTLATCPGCGTKNTAPGKIDDLMLVEIIGAGAMGVVYRAVDVMLHREVAVKVMKPQPGGKFAASVQSSLQEARAQARISHPNVAQVHTIIWHGEQPFIVMELLTGGNVMKLITKDPPMDEVKALKIGLDTARGLDAAWKAKLVFGDVKPANILLDSWGVAKLSDFGLSRMARGTVEQGDLSGSSIAEGSSMSEPVGPTGTASYVAPEMAKGKVPDLRTDIYSLGATMYHMLVGDVPFQGADKRAKIMARMNGVVPEVGVARPGVHGRTNAVVRKMMAFQPDLRHQSYEELIADLERALAGAKGEAIALQLGDISANPPIASQTAGVLKIEVPTQPAKNQGMVARLSGALKNVMPGKKKEEEQAMGELRRYEPEAKGKKAAGR